MCILIQGLWYGYSWNMIALLQAQADYETGYGTSTILREGNNVFGMRCVTQRKTTQISCNAYGNNGTFGGYRHIWSSVRDRVFWDKYAFGGQYFLLRKNSDTSIYINAIANRYFPSSENNQEAYINYVQDNIENKKSAMTKALLKVGALLLPFGYVIYLLIKKFI